MNIKNAEKLFVLITSNLNPMYVDECNMVIDVFLEEPFTMGELKRMLLYLLDKVKEERKDQVKLQIEKEIGCLEEQS